jgi:hypothetical protein
LEAFDVDDIWMRIVGDLADRVSGPMKFRLVLQPVMALIFAIISGLKDAKAGKPPYSWTLFTDPAHRAAMLKDGWKSVGKVFMLAIVLDVVYQFRVLHLVYPGEAIIVAIVLAIVPYLLLRGVVDRIASRKRSSPSRPGCPVIAASGCAPMRSRASPSRPW